MRSAVSCLFVALAIGTQCHVAQAAVAPDPSALAAADAIFASSFEFVAVIQHPADGEQRTAGQPVPFLGMADEPAALVWTSSIDGQIGTGTSFSAALSAGMHVITLTATTDGGDVAIDQITLNVAP